MLQFLIKLADTVKELSKAIFTWNLHLESVNFVLTSDKIVNSWNILTFLASEMYNII